MNLRWSQAARCSIRSRHYTLHDVASLASLTKIKRKIAIVQLSPYSTAAIDFFLLFFMTIVELNIRVPFYTPTWYTVRL